MAIPLKRSLKDKLSTVSDVYGIEEIIRKGIVRRYGFKGSVSAGDAVDAVAALLAATFNIPDRQTAYPTPPHDGNEGLEKFWVTSFWSGWDALDNFELLMEGVSRAKALQQAIVATSTVLFEKRQIKDLRLFRLAVIKDGPDLHVFRNPLALTRLGVWIAEGCAEAHLPPLPLVVAAFDLENNTYVVLGMGPRKPRDSSTSFADVSEVNKFGTAFQRTATRLNARVRIDGFESSVIQVAKDDLSRFLEALTISGLVA
jgi:cell division control protein 45